MRRLSLMAIAVVLCAALGGCTDEKKVGPIDDPSTTSAASPTPSKPTAPPLPADAKGDNPKAAAKFVEHYIALMNYSASTGDTAAMRAASRDCGTCDSYIKLYEKTYADGGFSENPGWRVLDPIARREGDHTTVLLDVRTREFKFSPKAGKEAAVVKATKYKLRFEVALDAGKWTTQQLDEQMSLE